MLAYFSRFLVGWARGLNICDNESIDSGAVLSPALKNNSIGCLHGFESRLAVQFRRIFYLKFRLACLVFEFVGVLFGINDLVIGILLLILVLKGSNSLCLYSFEQTDQFAYIFLAVELLNRDGLRKLEGFLELVEPIGIELLELEKGAILYIPGHLQLSQYSLFPSKGHFAIYFNLG